MSTFGADVTGINTKEGVKAINESIDAWIAKINSVEIKVAGQALSKAVKGERAKEITSTSMRIKDQITNLTKLLESYKTRLENTAAAYSKNDGTASKAFSDFNQSISNIKS